MLFPDVLIVKSKLGGTNTYITGIPWGFFENLGEIKKGLIEKAHSYISVY